MSVYATMDSVSVGEQFNRFWAKDGLVEQMFEKATNMTKGKEYQMEYFVLLDETMIEVIGAYHGACNNL